MMDRSIRLIFDYLTRIQQEKSVDNILLLLSIMARDLINSDRCTLWLFDPEKEIFWSKVALGLESKIEIASNRGIVGLAKEYNSPIIVNNAYSHPNFDPSIDIKTGYKTNNILVVPVKNKSNQVIGVYQAINKNDGEFVNEDITYLTVVSVYSSEVIEKALLLRELEETQREVIFRMGGIAEKRSKETGNHIKRVAEYSHLIALEYGLKEDEAELIKLASPMHDIGKVAIPDSILNKPAILTAEEFEIIKTHTTIGFEVLDISNKKILKNAAIIAHEHHEKWNGKGYPRGLEGEDIHIYGRILAVSDVFDALASKRPYKDAWELDKILELYKRERGKHFDPLMVDIFFDNLPKFVAIRDAYKDEIMLPDFATFSPVEQFDFVPADYSILGINEGPDESLIMY